jgi:hypothetical protein
MTGVGSEGTSLNSAISADIAHCPVAEILRAGKMAHTGHSSGWLSRGYLSAVRHLPWRIVITDLNRFPEGLSG